MKTEMSCATLNRKLGRSGMTLVEIVISFLLFTVLVTAVLLIMQPALRGFFRNRSVNEGMIVADILLEELEGRMSGIRDVSLEGDSQEGFVAEIITLDGQEEIICIQEGRLRIGDFSFGEGAYAGFAVTRLAASWEKQEEGILRLDLTLENEYDYTYSKTRLVKIY